MKVAIIGCGPAGLASAHAAAGLGSHVTIFGPKRKTPQRGPIMLHRPIPGINTEQPTGYVRQILIGGSYLDYRLKTYGDVNVDINGPMWEDTGFHTWPVPEAYDKMWDKYSHLIVNGELSPQQADDLRYQDFDLIINTAPLWRLCLNPKRHDFRSVPIALVFRTSYPNQPDNTVIYNADRNTPWIRSSSIFGREVTEYKPEDCPENDLIIRKPLSTTCTCHPGILRTGRFGKWHNETWIDHAYYETRTALVSMSRQHEWDRIK